MSEHLENLVDRLSAGLKDQFTNLLDQLATDQTTMLNMALVIAATMKPKRGEPKIRFDFGDPYDAILLCWPDLTSYVLILDEKVSFVRIPDGVINVSDIVVKTKSIEEIVEDVDSWLISLDKLFLPLLNYDDCQC